MAESGCGDLRNGESEVEVNSAGGEGLEARLSAPLESILISDLILDAGEDLSSFDVGVMETMGLGPADKESGNGSCESLLGDLRCVAEVGLFLLEDS